MSSDAQIFTAFQTAIGAIPFVQTLLNGGLVDGRRYKEISRQETPQVYDANRELMACAIIQPDTPFPSGGSNSMKGVQQTFTIAAYHPTSYENLDTMAHEVYQTLHDSTLPNTDSLSVIEVLRTPTRKDEVLDVPTIVIRYQITYLRT